MDVAWIVIIIIITIFVIAIAVLAVIGHRFKSYSNELNIRTQNQKRKVDYAKKRKRQSTPRVPSIKKKNVRR